jgi:hypothetical protein
MTTVIKHDQLKTLAANSGVKSVTIVGDAGGFCLNVTTLSGEKLLHTKTGKARSFKHVETLLDYLKNDIGVGKATILFDRWNPSQTALPV